MRDVKSARLEYMKHFISLYLILFLASNTIKYKSLIPKLKQHLTQCAAITVQALGWDSKEEDSQVEKSNQDEEGSTKKGARSIEGDYPM
jgi:hypothetical protein